MTDWAALESLEGVDVQALGPDDRAALEATVRTCGEVDRGELEHLLAALGVEARWIEVGSPIPHSHWGDREAGILGATLFLRDDTPVHSALHEACHVACARAEGRADLDTDAGGEQIEEDAVCYLQIAMADRLPGFGIGRAQRDMDAWGYCFRLGKARRWFEEDAEDARRWLEERDLLVEATTGESRGSGERRVW